MKNRNFFLATISAIFFTFITVITATANAGILLDPYVGYGFGKTKFSSPASIEFDNTATQFGARIAYTVPIFFIGADYMILTGKSKVTSGPGKDSDISGNALYLMVGAHIPLLRGYLGYGVLGNTVVKDSSSEATYTGSSMKLGVGFTGLPFVALNLEYYRDTYNKYKDSVLGDGSCDGTPNTYFLTVSLPLEF